MSDKGRADKLKVLLTERARKRLSELSMTDEQSIRLSADYEGGGCSCTVKVQMRLDRRNQQDQSTHANGICFIMDGETEGIFDNNVFQLDYQPSWGYVLRTDGETLAYGIKLLTN